MTYRYPRSQLERIFDLELLEPPASFFDDLPPPSTTRVNALSDDYHFAPDLSPFELPSRPDGYEVWESDPGWHRWTKWLGGEIIATSHQRFATEERAWAEAERDRNAGWLPIRSSARREPY